MEFVFDMFFEEIFESMYRDGLQTRQNRRDIIDRLNTVISGCMQGQNSTPHESAKIAILSAIDYHQRKKEENGMVN